jgi:long-chain acyl-CoA synthetase
MNRETINKVVFLTGTTGLIGSYLLRILLQNNCKVYALARSRDSKNAGERVVEALRFWDEGVLSSKHGNLVILEGDITQKNLGLGNHDIDLLKSEIEEIFHSAASTQFNLPLDEVRRYNVRGTRNLLELALVLHREGRLKKVNHLSTAYVCGDFKGVFREDDLDRGQGFNSTYEQSKFEAEKLIEGYRRGGLWIDVFRPPLVIGESLTGKTITFQQGVYQLLHMWGLEIFDYFPGRGCQVNIVHVDDLCNALFKIASNTPYPNRTYNLFDNRSVSLETILDISSEFIGFKRPVLVSPDEFFKKNPTPAQRMLLQNNILLYNNEVVLDSTTTNTLLKEYGFEFTGFNRESFLKVLEYCISRGFVKKRVV